MTKAGSFPLRLAAPPPGWEREVEVVVIGSGVAGLMVALTAATVGRVLIVTKAKLDAGSTSWAQGGIAAAIDRADDPEQHLDDTLVAGAGLCSERWTSAPVASAACTMRARPWPPSRVRERLPAASVSSRAPKLMSRAS